MATLNAVICAKNIRNTGYGECTLDLKMWRGGIKVPRNKVFSQTELDALRATLQAAVLADLKSNRAFPVHGFKTVTDNSEELVLQTMGDGSQVPVRDGNYRLTYQYIDGALCLSNALRSHNFGGQTTWLFYDDEFTLIGYRKLGTDGAYGLAGIPLLFHALPWKVHTGAEVAAYRLYFDILPKYLNELLGFVKADFPLSEITGLQNIVLKQTGASVAGVVKIQALTGCDYSNLYDVYSTELAAVGLWTATNVTTGNAITISSVAADANAKAFTITLSSADADYPATSTGLVEIGLVGPTALDAADVSGFEGIPVQVQRG